MYKFEIHLHSCGCSACGVSSSAEMAEAAAEHGYAGVVFTNHFYHGNSAVDRGLPWSDFVGAYRDDYLEGKKRGEQLGVTVLFGIEEMYEPGKEVLIYGLEPEELIGEPEFVNMKIREMSDFVHSKGGICVCAHPFRARSYIPDPDTEPDISCFDAVEGYNFFNQEIENEKAFAFAEKYGKPVTSGGDVHHRDSFGNAGIAFSEPVYNNEMFISSVKKGSYSLIINGQTDATY